MAIKFQETIIKPELEIITIKEIRGKFVTMSNGWDYHFEGFQGYPVGTRFAVVFEKDVVWCGGRIAQYVKIDDLRSESVMNISQLNKFRDNPMVRFKIETVGGKDYEIVSYMIANEDFWKDPDAVETRGNVFDPETGECVCAALPKFFNVGEREETNKVFVKNQFIEVYDKRDGSMVTPVLTPLGVKFKTKKSFYSDVAKIANERASQFILDFSKEMLDHDLTPIFELTVPQNRVVIDYKDGIEFTLLAIRSQKTGYIFPYDSTKLIVETFQPLRLESPVINLIPKLDLTWSEIEEKIETGTGIEGFVLKLKNGDRVKYKTKWYLSLHHTMTELRVRDVALACAEEKVDDMRSLLSDQGQDLTPIDKIETAVAEEFAAIREEVESVVNEAKSQGLDTKELAIKISGKTDKFPLIMRQWRNGEPDYLGWWKANRLRNYSLTNVFNESF